MFRMRVIKSPPQPTTWEVVISRNFGQTIPNITEGKFQSQITY